MGASLVRGWGRGGVHGPRTILADEPTGALDADSAEAVIDVLRHAQQELGAILIVVTHDVALAERLDRRLRLRDGRPVDASAPSAPDERRPHA